MPCCGGRIAPASFGVRGVFSAGPVSIPGTRSAFVLLPLVGAKECPNMVGVGLVYILLLGQLAGSLLATIQ